MDFEVRPIMFNYDAKPIEEIERKLDNLGMIGLNVVRINMSNVVPSETTTLVDILAQNPHIIGVGLGIGISNEVLELPKAFLYDKSQKLYNCENVKSMTVHLHQPPTVPLPKNLEELLVVLSVGRPMGRDIGAWLGKVITGKCCPVVKLIHMDNVQEWEGFVVPDKIKEIRFDKRRNIDKKLIEILKAGNFERLERNDLESVFVRVSSSPTLNLSVASKASASSTSKPEQ